MKRVITSSIALASLVLASNASAQSLSVSTADVNYTFNSAQTGVMEYAGGKTLTIQGKTFDLSAITGMKVVDGTLADNTVDIVYAAGKATVNVSGNIARYLDFDISGAHVEAIQGDEVGDDICGEITYILSGETADGSFTLTAGYKASIELHGVSITNPSGAAIDIESGKRTAIRVQEGTSNTLVDGASGSQKAALYSKGHLEFKQKGTLNVTGNKSHAIAAKEYIEVKNTVINIVSSKKDGINCGQHFLIESGEVNIPASGDDGIQVAYKEDLNREEEDTGAITVKGGKINIVTTVDAAKALKCEGDFIMSKGTINATVNGGGIWDTAKLKTKASACIGADGNLDISGGTLILTATGGGGKGINVDGNLNISGGDFTISTSGGMLAYVNGSINNNYTGNADNLNSDYKSSPKGIKVDGDIVIDGGTFLIETKGAGGEGLESKKTITINDGDIVIHAYEDGTNSANATTINGGNIEVTSGTGDAIDSNGPIYVNGGYIKVFGAGGAEQGFDAGDGYTIYFTGGTILAAGGGNSAPTTTNGSTQAYVVVSQQLTAGQKVTVTATDGTEVATFTVPDSYGTSANNPQQGPGGGGGGNWGWGWGGSTGSSLLLSSPLMASGQTYTVTAGTSTTTATAQLTGGSSGPGGGGH